MSSKYQVKTAAFEGPLDLLLTLIERRRLLINDISLSTVTDDFVEHVSVDTSIQLSERAHFVLVASTLLLIKSKSLLPTLRLTEEEERDVDDLERRLQLYALFRSRAGDIRKRFGRTPLFPRTLLEPSEPLFAPHASLTLKRVRDDIRSVLRALPVTEITPRAIVEKVLSLEEAIQGLAERIGKTLQMSFREFSGLGKKEKTHVIVHFLAMLELVKQGAISVVQSERFADIVIESDTVSIPTYR